MSSQAHDIDAAERGDDHQAPDQHEFQDVGIDGDNNGIVYDESNGNAVVMKAEAGKTPADTGSYDSQPRSIVSPGRLYAVLAISVLFLVCLVVIIATSAQDKGSGDPSSDDSGSGGGSTADDLKVDDLIPGESFTDGSEWQLAGKELFGPKHNELDFANNNNYGHVVALSYNGRRLAVGYAETQGDDEAAMSTTSEVYVYHFNETAQSVADQWSYEETITPPEPGADGLPEVDLYAVYDDVDTVPTSMTFMEHECLALSEDGEKIAFTGGHLIYVYNKQSKYQNYRWDKIGQTIDPFVETLDGRTRLTQVAFSADGVTLAAMGDVGGGSRVVVYQENITPNYDGSGPTIVTWEQLPDSIDIPETGGGSLAMNYNGNRFVVTTPDTRDPDTGEHMVGALRVYDYSKETAKFQQVGQTIYGDNEYDRLGDSSSISGNGNYIAVSSVRGNYVRVYMMFGSKWKMVGDELLGESSFAKFGASLALNHDGNILAVGSPGTPESLLMDSLQNDETLIPYRVGRVHVYQMNYSLKQWQIVGNQDALTSASQGVLDDAFGSAIAITYSGDRVAVGAPLLHIDGFSVDGSVSVFDLK